MLEYTPIGAFIKLLNEMMHWFSLHEIRNSFTLLIEIIIGVGIALYLFYLQSKTNKSNEAVISKINEVTQKIDIYIEEKKKLEETTKKFYVEGPNLLY